MKNILAILLLLSLAACVSYPYPVRDGGDGVYYASSPPAYTYVDGYFGFPYYGPYSWAWYHPIWYSPIRGHHYSWCLPHDYWCGPSHWPARSMARHYPVNVKKPATRLPSNPAADLKPVLPVDLNQMVVLRSDLKRQSDRSPKAKYYSAAKPSRKSYPAYRASSVSKASSASYRSSRSASRSRVSLPSSVRSESKSEY